MHSAGALPAGYPSHLYSEFRDSTGPLPPYSSSSSGGGVQSSQTPRVSCAEDMESRQIALVDASLDAGSRPQSAPQVPQQLLYKGIRVKEYVCIEEYVSLNTCV